MGQRPVSTNLIQWKMASLDPLERDGSVWGMPGKFILWTPVRVNPDSQPDGAESTRRVVKLTLAVPVRVSPQ